MARNIVNRNFGIDEKHDKYFQENPAINASAFARQALDKHIKDTESLRKALMYHENPEMLEAVKEAEASGENLVVE